MLGQGKNSALGKFKWGAGLVRVHQSKDDPRIMIYWVGLLFKQYASRFC